MFLTFSLTNLTGENSIDQPHAKHNLWAVYFTITEKTEHGIFKWKKEHKILSLTLLNQDLMSVTLSRSEIMQKAHFFQTAQF